MKPILYTLLLLAASSILPAQGICLLTPADQNRDFCEVCSTDMTGSGAALVDGVFNGTLQLSESMFYTISASCLSTIVFETEFNVITDFKSYLTFEQDPTVVDGITVTADYTRKQGYIRAYGIQYQPEGNQNTYVDFANRMMTDPANRVAVSPSASAALPVVLTAWSASSLASGVQLNWTTAVELDNAGFTVEHSTDGREFRTLAGLRAKNNGDAEADYSYLHERAAAGTHYYRLLQHDFDGTTTAFQVLEVSIITDQIVAAAYPNPTAAGTELSFSAPAGATTATLFRLDGARMTTATVKGSGTQRLQVPDGAAPGVYLLRVGSHSERIVIR